jgi:hypothetical protein
LDCEANTLVGDWLDCSALIEDPLLLVIAFSVHSDLGIWSVPFDHSVGWKSWSDIEWSIDLPAELFVKSLGLHNSLVSVENLPFLVGIVGLLGNDNWLIFLILGLLDIKAHVGSHSVTQVVSLESEDLPPLGVSVIDLHNSALSTALDI